MQEPLTAAGDRLIAVANGTVNAISAHDGSPVGTTDTVNAQKFPYTMTALEGGLARPVASGGNLYFADGPKIVALRLADGTPLPGWSPPQVSSVSAIVAAADHIVVSGLDGSGATTVSAFSAVDGSPAFGPLKVSDRSAGPVGVGDGALFFVADNQPQAVNVDFGDNRWAAHPPSVTDAGSFDNSMRPVVVGTTAIFAAGDLVALDTRTAKERWRCPASAPNVSWLAPAVDAGGSAVVAVSTAGDVFAIDVATGTVRWHVTCPAPLASTVDDRAVYVPQDGGTTLTVRDLADGTVTQTYPLPEALSAFPPVVIDGVVFIVNAEHQIVARAFGEQSAAWFDGSSSRIEVDPDGGAFDVGLGDFTVEAWFRSTVGGEILSSHPTQPLGHGLRLNVTPDGQLRVAVLNPALNAYNVAQTGPTNATDGAWHHVAFARAAGVLVVAVDGLGITLMTVPQPAAPLPLDGENGLTIGARRSSFSQTPDTHFCGLLREVRFWDIALDLPTIQMNLNVELTGAEPHLKGLWRLDGPASAAPANAAVGQGSAAQFVNPAVQVTALTMDRSAFPYLIHEVAQQWPYSGTWGARGEDPVSPVAPAVAASAVAGALLSDGITWLGALYSLRPNGPPPAAGGQPATIEMTIPSGAGAAGASQPLARQIAAPPSTTTGVFTPTWKHLGAFVELAVLVVNAAFAAALIGIQIKTLLTQPEYSSDHNPDYNLRQAARVLAGRYISLHVPPMLGWLFTQTPAGDLLETGEGITQVAVSATRFAANTSGLICHCVAGFDYLT